MKSRLAATIHLFSAGKCLINTRSTVSSRSTFAAFDRHHGQIDCSSKAQGFESSNRAIHSAALEDDAFSELGPGESECSALVTEKLDDFVSSVEDDAFSELGPGISEYSDKQIKLVTEKRDRVPKTQSQKRESASKPKRESASKPKRESASKPLSSGNKPNAKELFAAIARASTISSTKSDTHVHALNAKKLFGAMAQPSTSSSTKLHSPSSTDHKDLASSPLSSESNANDLLGATSKDSTASSTKLPSSVHAPTSTDDTKKVSEVEYPLSVTIQNIPHKVGLPELIEAISVFGKVSGASFVTKADKYTCCNIEFEDADSSRRAILAGKVEVGSKVYLVNSLCAVDLVAVRIKNINEKTADSAIHSICKSVGELVGLTRTSKNGADAFFYVQNDKSHSGIVKKLNKRVVDLNCWSAHALKSIPNSSEVPSDKDVRYNLQRHILNQFDELKRELHIKEMNLQDLQYLTASILHIRDVPPAPNQSGNG